MQAQALLFVFVCICLFSLLFFSPKQLVQYLFNACSTLVQFLVMWDCKTSFLGLWDCTVAKLVA